MNKKRNHLNVFVGSTDRHYLQKDYDEIKDNQKKSWHGVGWKNDQLTSEILLVTGEEVVENIEVCVSDFLNEDYDILDASNLSLRQLKESDAYIGRGEEQFVQPEGPKEKIPDIIHQELPITVQEKRVQALWLTIDLPDDAEAGIYEGEIIFTADDFGSLSLNYSFEVLDLQLPDQEDLDNDFSMELWQYPYSVARYYRIAANELFKEKHLKIVSEQLKAYKRAGGDSISVTVVEDPWNHQTYDPYPSMIQWSKKADGQFEYQYEHFDAYVELALDLGINQQIKSFSMVPWENRIIYYDESKGKEITKFLEPGSKEWTTVWASFLDSYVSHLDEKGWFDLTYIAMDERSLADMQAVIDLVQQHKNKEGKSLKISGAMDYNAVSDQILDQIDDISISFNEINHNEDEVKELAEHRRSLGFTTTMYTMTGQYPNSFSRSHPSEIAWVIWYAESQKLDGYLRWALDAWVDDPLKDITHWWWESGDPFLIYPRERDSEMIKPYSSPRYERMAEATRDIRKIRYLKSLAPSLEETFNKLLESLGRRDGKVNDYGAMEAASEADQQFISGELSRMQEGLNKITRDYLASL